MTSDILGEYRATFMSEQRKVALQGRVLLMDGERWFHPDNGDAPWRLSKLDPIDFDYLVRHVQMYDRAPPQYAGA